MNRKAILILILFLVVFAPIAAYAAPFHYNGYYRTGVGNGTVIGPAHHHLIKNPYYHNLGVLPRYNAFRGYQKVYELNGYTFRRFSDYKNYYNYLYSHPELYDCEACPTCPGCEDDGALVGGVPSGGVPVGATRLRYIYR